MTLYLLAERILRLFYGGDPSDDAALGIEDIKRLIVGQMNIKLKTETISLNRQLGDNAPTNLMLATYDDVSTEVYGGVQSRALLPAIPISLPMNMGVWWVSPDADDETRHNQFIPLQQGQWTLIKDNGAFVGNGFILGNRTYEVDGKYLVFPVNITTDVPKLTIKLVVTDFSLYGDYDLLPIPADYADQIVMDILNILRPTPPVKDVTNDANSQK